FDPGQALVQFRGQVRMFGQQALPVWGAAALQIFKVAIENANQLRGRIERRLELGRVRIGRGRPGSSGVAHRWPPQPTGLSESLMNIGPSARQVSRQIPNRGSGLEAILGSAVRLPRGALCRMEGC